MKKTLSLLLVLPLLYACLPSVAGAELDLTYLTENSGLFSVQTDVENDVSFVETTMSVKNRSFVHRYESDTRYSFTGFDVLIVDRSTPDAFPILRLWITYCADEFLNVSSVTFTVGDEAYTFTDIADPEWQIETEDGVIEQVMIRFGSGNLAFAEALAELIRPFEDDYTLLLDESACPKVDMVLHGDRDADAVLGSGFISEFFALLMAVIHIGGTLDNVTGTPMTVSAAE